MANKVIYQDGRNTIELVPRRPGDVQHYLLRTNRGQIRVATVPEAKEAIRRIDAIATKRKAQRKARRRSR